MFDPLNNQKSVGFKTRAARRWFNGHQSNFPRFRTAARTISLGGLIHRNDKTALLQTTFFEHTIFQIILATTRPVIFPMWCTVIRITPRFKLFWVKYLLLFQNFATALPSPVTVWFYRLAVCLGNFLRPRQSSHSAEWKKNFQQPPRPFLELLPRLIHVGLRRRNVFVRWHICIFIRRYTIFISGVLTGGVLGFAAKMQEMSRSSRHPKAPTPKRWKWQNKFFSYNLFYWKLKTKFLYRSKRAKERR